MKLLSEKEDVESKAKEMVFFLLHLKNSNSARFETLVSQRQWLDAIGLTKRELQVLLEAYRFFIDCGVAFDGFVHLSFQHALWVFEQAKQKKYRVEETVLLLQWVGSKSASEIGRRGEMIAQLIIEQDSEQKRKILRDLASQILKGKDRWPPQPDSGNFFVNEADWRQLTLNVHRAGFLLLIGPSGCGKTEVVNLVAKAMKRNLHSFAFGAMTDPRPALFGSNQYDPQRGTYFVPSRFLQAIQQPRAIIRLDEVNRCDSATQNCLFSLLDGQRSLDIDEDGSVVHVHEQVSFFGTANVGMEYVGATKIDQALMDRADVIIRMDFPKCDIEAKLLVDRTRITQRDADVLVKIASEQRRLAAKQEFANGLSTRRLMRCAEQRALGISLKEAIHYTINGHFSDEGGSSADRCRFIQLVQKYL
ncbi:MAG: AAA family ATPase [Planctomycetaceae bacterium]|nr:AAA family ATPase [Planctomycetaceae bacterium]